MNYFRNNTIIRELCLLVLLISHISLIFFYFILIQPEIKVITHQTGNQYIISGNDISTWVNSNNNQKTLQIQLLSSFILLGFLPVFRRMIAPAKQLKGLFSQVVKVYRLSPTYILNRILII